MLSGQAPASAGSRPRSPAGVCSGLEGGPALGSTSQQWCVCSHYVFTVFSAQTLRSAHEGSRVQTHRGHVSTATVKMQTVRPPERVYHQSRA